MSNKLENNLKPGVTKLDFYVTLASGLITTATACLGLIDGQWAVIIISAITTIWTWVRSHVGGKDNNNTAALLLLFLFSPCFLTSCGEDSFSYVKGDYKVTVERVTDKSGEVAILPNK